MDFSDNRLRVRSHTRCRIPDHDTILEEFNPKCMLTSNTTLLALNVISCEEQTKKITSSSHWQRPERKHQCRFHLANSIALQYDHSINCRNDWNGMLRNIYRLSRTRECGNDWFR